MVKKIWIILAALAVLLLLFVLTLPVWMPWVARPIMERQGVTFDRYERPSYGRFVLHDVRYEAGGLEVRAGRVEAFAPTAWAWSRWRGNREVDFAVVEDWLVRIEPGEAEPREDPPGDEEGISVYDVLGQIEAQMPRVIDWVPRARLGPGDLYWSDRQVEVRGARWEEGILTAEVHDRALQQVVHFQGDLSGGLPYRFQGRTHPFPLALEVTVARTASRVEVRSEANLAGNALRADADFAREGAIPERAIFRSDRFRIPTEYLRIDGYRDVVGDLLFQWEAGRFIATLRGDAEPSPGQEHFPPIHVDLAAEGDLESFVINTLELRSPWLVANLSAPVAMNFQGEFLSEESVFTLAADLARQPFVEASGQIRGEAHVRPGEELAPVVNLRLEGQDLTGFGFDVSRFALDGFLRWPAVGLLDLQVEGPDGSLIVGSADIDVEKRLIERGALTARILPALMEGWLGAETGFSQLTAEATFSGPFNDLRHEGTASVTDGMLPQVHRFDAGLTWAGAMEQIEDFRLVATAGEGQLTVAGATELGDDLFRLRLAEFSLERAGEAVLTSDGVTNVVARWSEEGPVSFSIDRLRWVATDGEIEAAAEVAWPDHGDFRLNMAGIRADLIQDFVDVSTGAFDLRELAAEGSWTTGGPLLFQVGATLQIDLEGEKILLQADAEGAPEAIRIRRLRATSAGQDLAVAEGVLPVVIRPGDESLYRIRHHGDIDFLVHTEPHSRFWQLLGDATGVRLQEPNLAIELRGTPFEPVGSIQGTAAAIRIERDDVDAADLPVLERLSISASLDTESIRIDRILVEAEGQAVELTAHLGMGADRWERVIEGGEIPDWREATARLRIPEAQVGAFARFYPALLTPQGVLSADVTIHPGLVLDGVMTVDGVATRPLLPLGSIQEGTARIDFQGRTAYVREISGIVGGERLVIEGTIDVPFEQEPGFSLRLRGNNIPLARQPGLIVRADLDLGIDGKPESTPVISGRINMRNSFYLAQLRLMPAGAVATPDRRPPFFSIEQEPFANWLLDVEIRGREFLTVRGPIFRGILSSQFQLAGTLVEPRAVGNVTIDSGQVRFPFAAMRIEQGEVTLTRENPYRPQLFIIAASTTFGYDLRMEITGTADAPVIEFTSNPPLTSEQALLMVTAGELPRGDATFTTQQRASKFAVYIGQNLLYELTGDESAADRLIIRSGEHISEGGRETFAIEFRLSERWSVLGEYDRFDQYNAGLKWNIFSR